MTIRTVGDNAAPSPHGTPFAHPAFTCFWVARLTAALAGQVQSIAIGWQIYSLARVTLDVERSAFLVGLLGLAQFVPLALLSLVAGAQADRHDRRAIMLVSLGVEIACAAFLAIVTFASASNLWPLFVVAALLGGARAFLSPAASAALPLLVPREKLARAVSLNQLADQAGWLIGPWLGGTFAAFSIAAAYGLAAALYTAAATALLLVRMRTRPQPQNGSQLHHIREGLIYVWTNKTVLGAISLDLFAVLIGGVTALMPAFASDVLNVGASGFGALRTAPAVGAVVMALAVTRWPLSRRAGRWMFTGVAAFGVSILAFAVSKSLYLSLVALAALGASDMVSVYIRQTLIQVATPDHMRGRVSAVAGIFISGSAELGEFETGVAARLLGPVGAAIFGGLGTLVVAGTWSRLFPSLRNADRLDGGDS